MIITLDNLKSFDKSLENNDNMEWQMPQFFVHDLQRVALYSIIGNQYRFFPRFLLLLFLFRVKKSRSNFKE